MSEREFVSLLNPIAADFFKLTYLLKEKQPHEWAKRCYSSLSEKAHNLESYLDEYNARNNRTFSFIRELFAALKWFGTSAFIQKHILIRFPNYAIDGTEDDKQEFLGDSQKTLTFLHDSIRALIENLYEESKNLQLQIPNEPLDEITAYDPYERRLLPHTIGGDISSDPKNIIAEVATLYRTLAGKFRKIKISKDLDIESIKTQTLYDFDETKTRHFESQIHNIQSKYDTYIKSTSLESKHPELAYFRGYTSVSLHLFEMATILVHFYERHMNDIGPEKIEERILGVISQEELLHVLNGYVRYWGVKFFLEGESFADRIIEKFVEIQTVHITPLSDFALHARPLSLIAKIALYYKSPLEIEIDGRCCNASSIMQMILLAGNNPRPRKITFRGEERALRDIKDLFDIGCLEGGNVQDVPPHLNYLLQ